MQYTGYIPLYQPTESQMPMTQYATVQSVAPPYAAEVPMVAEQQHAMVITPAANNVAGTAPVVRTEAAAPIHIEPVRVACWMKVFFRICYLGFIIALIFDIVRARNRFQFEDHPYLIFMPIVWDILVLFILTMYALFRLPKSVTLQASCLTLQTRAATYSLAYERVQSVMVLRSVLCARRRGCGFKGAHTSCRNGVVFHTTDCGQSIWFTPADLPRFLNALQATPLAARVESP